MSAPLQTPPHAPYQFVVCCILIALVFGAWLAFAERQVKDSDG